MSRQEPLQQPQIVNFKEPNSSLIVHVCDFMCGGENPNILFKVYVAPQEPYEICFTEKLRGGKEQNLYVEANTLEEGCIWICRYCLNNFIIESEKEIIYVDIGGECSPIIDETEIPYDMIKYFDFTAMRGEEKNE